MSETVYLRFEGHLHARTGVLTMQKVFDTAEKRNALPPSMRGNMEQCPYFWVYFVRWSLSAEALDSDAPGMTSVTSEVYEGDDSQRRIKFFAEVSAYLSGFPEGTVASRAGKLFAGLRMLLLMPDEPTHWTATVHDDPEGGWYVDESGCRNTFEPTKAPA